MEILLPSKLLIHYWMGKNPITILTVRSSKAACNSGTYAKTTQEEPQKDSKLKSDYWKNSGKLLEKIVVNYWKIVVNY